MFSDTNINKYSVSIIVQKNLTFFYPNKKVLKHPRLLYLISFHLIHKLHDS